MHDINLHRIPFSLDAINKLRTLKGRTKITPNILCRIGFCLSLEEPGLPEPISKIRSQDNSENETKDINRYTLLGKYDKLFVSLLLTNLNAYDVSKEEIDDYFIAHMNRGVDLVTTRIKSLADFENLINLQLRL